ncbi:MAG: hypothetical protein Kow00104_13560 [Rhodothalassiaceae bacterium]
MLWLARKEDRFLERSIVRFDPRFWTVNFPRPMMAALTNPGPEAMRVDLVFYRRSDLAGLIWESEDRFDHPLLSYETSRDYRGVRLRFRWRSAGIRALPDLFGPTLTIEGRDQTGAARSWFVRLWNYASGSPEDATILLDFDDLAGGFLLPSEADPVWAGEIDRMFISMVAQDFDAADNSPLTGGPVEAHVEIDEIRTTGGHADLAIGDDYIKPHPLRAANGYDDSFNVAPARILRNLLQLGHRDWLTHYVGMSHYYSLRHDSAEERWIVDPLVPLNKATIAWHSDFFTRLARFGFRVALSLSYEILYENAPLAWAQRAADGSPALTGWVPPSTLIAPTSDAALSYLEQVYDAFGQLIEDAGLDPVFQIGEPWWWVSVDGSRRPHFYDAGTMAAWSAETGLAVPAPHQNAQELPDAAQIQYLDWLGDRLGRSTLRLRDHLKTRWPDALVTLLFFTPQVLDDSAPMLKRVNFPAQFWGFPAFDFLQIEDYDHVIDGDWAAHDKGLATVRDELGYPYANMHFFAGFVRNPEDSFIWPNIALALEDARRRGFGERVIWAYSQILRDGAVSFEPSGTEDDMTGFHDTRLPVAISFGSTGGPRFSTAVTVTASGFERRNRDWQQARSSYDISTGIRSLADLETLMAFFRARAGRAHGFRFRDWADFRSAAHGAEITPLDQTIGTGDGIRRDFQLVKRYGPSPFEHVRTITKPVAESVRVALDGVETTSGFSIDPLSGVLRFDTAPPAGTAISAGFEFDIPVRFDDDSLAISLEAFEAGQIPAIRLTEIRE